VSLGLVYVSQVACILVYKGFPHKDQIEEWFIVCIPST